MYESYFGLTERPFSIAPDPQYLYMSTRHKEAMAHLTYGLSQGGCFIVLTGEVGTGKTTLCRNLLSDLPDNVDVALILNANINELELLQTICDELKISYQEESSQKQHLDLINKHLLDTFAKNRHTVLIIDEAQLLSRDVLEQIRLLTNLETTKSKLLQIILIGQPELNDILARNDLRQLAQRVTARYHLGALRQNEIEEYVNYRLAVAGCRKPLFSKQALTKLHQLSDGIPRKINVLADHALLGAYSQNQPLVESSVVKEAAGEVFVAPSQKGSSFAKRLHALRWWVLAALLLMLNIALWFYLSPGNPNSPKPVNQTDSAAEVVTSPELTSSDTNNNLDQDANSEASNPAKLVENQNRAESSETVQINNQNEASLSDKLTENSEPDSIPNPEKVEQKISDAGTDSANQSLSKTALANLIDKSTLDDSIKPGKVTIADEYLDASDDIPADESSSISNIQSASSLLGSNQFDENTEFGQLLDTSADLTGRISAFRNLAEIWDTSLPESIIKPPCTVLVDLQLRCLGVTNWQQIKRYNRPAIMVLKHQNQLHRVIVTGIGEDQVDLMVGKIKKSLSQDELIARWNGKALIFWKPVVGSQLLQLGMQGDNIKSVRRYLNRALAQDNLPVLDSIDSQSFDMDMSQKTFALQTHYSIISDSKIGYETYLLMNELVLPNTTPVLLNRKR